MESGGHIASNDDLVFGTDAVGQAITNKGPEFAIAYELARIWATGAQVLCTGAVTMVIMREQTTLNVENADTGQVSDSNLLIKNVGSFVMPTDAAESLWKLLGQQLGKTGSDAG